MAARMIALLTFFVACSTASPIGMTNYPIQAIPVFVEEQVENKSAPVIYAFLLDSFGNPKPSLAQESSMIEKRSPEEPELEDLETAAGTNALRPLFVYRQQVAYRQRVRDAIRRRSRF